MGLGKMDREGEKSRDTTKFFDAESINYNVYMQNTWE